MADEYTRSESVKSHMYAEQENCYRDSLRRQHFEVELWQMRIEMLTRMKNQEVQKKSELINTIKSLQNEINQKRNKNCEFVHNLIKSSWLSNLNNLKSLTQTQEFGKKGENNQSLSLFVCNKLKDELNEINLILEGLQIQRDQHKVLMEYTNKTNSIEHSIAMWDDAIIRIEKKQHSSEKTS